MSDRAGLRMWSFLALPWNVFVAVFLYYTLLAAITLSGLELSVSFIVAAYAIPLVVYAGALLVRAARAVASVRIDLFHTPHALAR